MQSKLSLSYKLAAINQKTLIHHWLEQKHIKQWLHGEGLQNTLNDLETFFKGGDCIFGHWIAYEKEIPFAYLMTSDIEKEAISLDLFICDLNYLGKGLSVPMIQEFLRSQFPAIEKVYIDPEATNTRAIHVYQKVGFKIIEEFIAPWHPVPHYRMCLERKKQ
jgi:RimJ/RimL family protein N-acetyltransferase